jgi:hypothetical protein
VWGDKGRDEGAAVIVANIAKLPDLLLQFRREPSGC